MTKISQAEPVAVQESGRENSSILTRRKEPRTSVSIQLRLRRQADKSRVAEPVQTENISRYGACLLTPAPLEVGEIVTLHCPNDECEMRATVKYVRQVENQWKAGVEFVAFPKKWLIMQLAVSAILEGTFAPPRRRRAIRG